MPYTRRVTTEAAAAHLAAVDSAVEFAIERRGLLTARDLADHAGYSPFHFSRLFLARTGIGPGQYLSALRIDAAKRLLLADRDAVIDVAAAVGFDSLSSFSRRFKESVGVAPARLRRLADEVADRPPQPFALVPNTPASARVRLELPPDFSQRGDASIWVGWYPQPAPIGLPKAGMLAAGVPEVSLPLAPGAPYLLGFAVAAHSNAPEQLVPARPMVAVHPGPIAGPCDVTLRFAGATHAHVPLLSALPALCRHIRV